MFFSDETKLRKNNFFRMKLISGLALVCTVAFSCAGNIAEAASKKHHPIHKKTTSHAAVAAKKYVAKKNVSKKHRAVTKHKQTHHIKHHHNQAKNITAPQQSSVENVASDISISYEGSTLIAGVEKKAKHKPIADSEKVLTQLTTPNNENKTQPIEPPKVINQELNQEADKNNSDDTNIMQTVLSVFTTPPKKTEAIVAPQLTSTPLYLTKTNVTDEPPVERSRAPWHPGFALSFEKHVVNFVHKVVENLHYSDYKLGGKKFDTSRGVYIVDCSSFVDHILQRTTPQAYSSLVNATGADSPASQHYYEFFTELSSGADSFWNKVDAVDQLRPGDILVFRYKNSHGAATGGHVMVVMDKPIQDSDVFFVRVADSAPSRHSQDTRQRNEAGIGIGTLLLKINPHTGRPAAYAWGLGGLWNRNVNFAMARPLDSSNLG